MRELLTVLLIFTGINIFAGDLNATLNFEQGQQWRSIPPGFASLMKEFGVEEKDLWCAQSYDNDFWKLESVSLEQLSAGIKLSDKFVKQGKNSGLWSDLPTYPTIATADIPHNWSRYNSLSIWIYSVEKTGDVITAGFLSNNDKTVWKDYFTYPVKIDWQGWKRVVIPFTELDKIGSPQGFEKVDAIYFFAKANGHQPNPYAELYLDKISLENSKEIAGKSQSEGDDFLYIMKHKDKVNPAALNHNHPEKVSTTPEIADGRFISHQTYHRKERSIYKYYPRFEPGYVSFDPQGKAFIYSGDVIEWLDDQGKWQLSNLKPVLIEWARSQGWQGMKNNWGSQGGDPVIRFDNDGDMYVLAAVTKYRPDGREDSWKNRLTLLLHSQDRGKKWRVYKLPGRMVSFEKLDGHNRECLQRPPVILISDYTYFPGVDYAKYILLPEKQADGSLDLTRKIKYSEDSVEINYHSGDGNVVLTANGKIYVAYGWNPSKHRYRKIAEKLKAEGKEWSLENLKGTDAVRNLPAMPEQHQGLELSFHQRNHLPKGSEYYTKLAKNGVPTFIRSYDLQTGELSDPVYIGSGGGMLDGHNWPAITIDSKGIIHALINGHHNPVVYTHTLKPYDISGWTPPEYIKTTEYTPCLSYATFNCDRDDTLYSTHRSTTGYYNNRISIYRKKAGQRWEPERTLVAPFKGLYFAWRHRMSYDPSANRLVLTYYSSGSMSCMSRDMYEFLIFQRPEQEMTLRRRIKELKIMPQNPYWDSWQYTIFTNPDAGELTSIISDDGGDEWRLLTTPDLMGK